MSSVLIMPEPPLGPKEEIKKAIGSLEGIEIFHNQVLVAVYIRPEKTKGGIIRPDYTGGTRDEDKWQGKVGLIVKTGPEAFNDPTGTWFKGVTLGLDDWIIMRAGDGWSIVINGVLCRILDDTVIRGKVDDPEKVL